MLNSSRERVVRPASRSEPVAEPENLRLKDRHRIHVCHRLLNDPVLQCGDAKRSRSAVRLGYLDPPNRRRAAPSPVQPSMQLDQAIFQPVGMHFPRHAIHAGGQVTPERVERLRQHGHRDVVQERNQTLFRVSLRSLPYPVGRPNVHKLAWRSQIGFMSVHRSSIQLLMASFQAIRLSLSGVAASWEVPRLGRPLNLGQALRR